MGPPRSGVLGWFSLEIKSAIDNYRPGKEGWGAGTIAVELELETQFSLLPKPSVRSINRYLKSTQKIRAYWKAEKLPEEPVIFSSYAHDVWQMDAEGNKRVEGVGTVSTINLKDTFSKTYVTSYPCSLAGNFNHPKKEDYQCALRLGFLEFGRCNRLQLDHESIYYENTNATPFPTPFHLWVLSMGISISFTPKAKPYKQGAVERKHRTMHQQTCAGRAFNNWADLFAFCQQRRHRLNHHIPCRMLAGKAPLQVFPEAINSDKPYDPRREEEYFDLGRIYEYLAQGRWIRAVTAQRTFCLGARTYALKEATPNTSVVITFDPLSKDFLCSTVDGALIQHLQPKGLSFKELCGNLEGFINWVSNCPNVKYP